MYLPTKNISTHPRYVGSGVFGSIGKVLGKLASKVSGEAAKKLAKKAVSTAGEQASKAILKKTQAVADEKVAHLIDNVMKRAKAKPKSYAVTASEAGRLVDEHGLPPTDGVLEDVHKHGMKVVKELKAELAPKAVKKAAKSKSKTSKPKPVTPEEIINKLIAGSGTAKPKSLRSGGVLKLEDIINRGINTPFLPPASPFTGSGIKTT